MIRIKPSERNTNKHTEQGMELLQKSIEKVGVIESISVADDGTIISGHARKEVFDKKGMKPKEIELADDEFAVLKTKIKANSKEYYEAQILANTTGNKNYNLDIEEIEIIAEEYGIDIEEMGLGKIKEELDPMDLFNIEIPFYKPKDEKPLIENLANTEETDRLINKINVLNIPEDLKKVLRIRAGFFTDFNFNNIADYYYNSDDELKEIMKVLGMVIVTPKEAVNLGFAEMADEIFDL